MDEPSPSYVSVTQGSYTSQPQQQNHGPPSVEHLSNEQSHPELERTRTATGSSQDSQCFQPCSVAGSSFPQYTYHTVSATPVPVQGGYQYSPSQGVLPLQGSSSRHCTPLVYSGYTATRHRFVIVFLVIFCFLILILTVVFVVIFVALKPASDF